MTTWTSKDPQAVQDYTYTIPLDEGDSVASATFTKLSGDVVIDNDPEAERVDDLITVWLSGGTEGETNIFRVAWVTSDGRTDDDGITLAILSNEYEALELTGYAKPNVQHLIARYPAFSSVEPTTIAYWLTDAERYVDTTWSEIDYAVALMAMAAHQMAAKGLGTTSAAISSLPAGVSSFKSADLSVTLSSAAADGRATGALSSTIYGTEFIALRRRNHAGPRVASPGTVPLDPRVFPMGET